VATTRHADHAVCQGVMGFQDVALCLAVRWNATGGERAWRVVAGLKRVAAGVECLGVEALEGMEGGGGAGVDVVVGPVAFVGVGRCWWMAWMLHLKREQSPRRLRIGLGMQRRRSVPARSACRPAPLRGGMPASSARALSGVLGQGEVGGGREKPQGARPMRWRRRRSPPSWW
jgi:hypothetical protein